ncbi:hypothetical protein [Intrasporangium sp. DVR]|uniref:hypothetical protein n=1 Tax=Intrasporangium sp. DVR TaxID=3127867 RepID=UPI00313A6480
MAGRVEVAGGHVGGSEAVLTPGALAFVASLQREFGPRRDELPPARRSRREEVARSGRLVFLEETAHVRDSEWTVAPARVLEEVALADEFADFLALPAYEAVSDEAVSDEGEGEDEGEGGAG